MKNFYLTVFHFRLGHKVWIERLSQYIIQLDLGNEKTNIYYRKWA